MHHQAEEKGDQEQLRVTIASPRKRVEPDKDSDGEKQIHWRHDPEEARQGDDPKLDRRAGDGIHPRRSQAEKEQPISLGAHESPGKEEPKTQEDGIRDIGDIRPEGNATPLLAKYPDQQIERCGAAEVDRGVGILARLPLQQEKAEAEQADAEAGQVNGAVGDFR